jgi:hypothetical protein
MGLVVALLLLGVRLIWGWYTTAALRNEVAKLRSRGQPIEAADFAFVPVPDAENAAKYQFDAARAANPAANPPRATNMIYSGYPPYDAAWMTAAEGSEAAHGKLFALAREACRHTRVQWNSQPWRAPLGGAAIVGVIVGQLNGIRHLANVLADGAELAHVRGNDVEAIERLRDLRHLARSLRHDDTMISQLVAIGIEAMACSATMTIAPGLRLDMTTPPATRAEAQALIAELLDEDDMRRGFAQSFRVERAVMHEARQAEGAGTWVIRPLVNAQLVREHHNYDVYVGAASLPNKPQVMAALTQLTAERPEDPTRSGVPRYSRWFGQYMNLERYFETWYRVLAERRTVAVSLTAQLFRADHGRWPAKLEDLVPTYLPAVPLDPFTEGEALGYVVQPRALPDGRDRPLVFQRGGEIDYGPYPEPSYSWEGDRRPGVVVRKDLWQYRDLARFVPPSMATMPASTQAVYDQP